MMITFHTLYIADFLGIANTMTISHLGFWWWFPRVTAAGPFIFLAGLSVPIAQSRPTNASSFAMRGLQILGLGMAITLVTWLVPTTRTLYVRFGILHFFGIAFLLAPFFTRFRFINLILGAALMALGIYLDVTRVAVGFPWLFWLGLKPYHFSSLDYFPLLPWFGLFLLGMFCGKMLYPQGNRRFNIPESNDAVTSVLTLPGRHPLVIYLAQWPAIVGVLLLLFPGDVLPLFEEAISHLPL